MKEIFHGFDQASTAVAEEPPRGHRRSRSADDRWDFGLDSHDEALVPKHVFPLVMTTDAVPVGRRLLIPPVEVGSSSFYGVIDTLCRLQVNWNGYGSEPPNAVAAAHACWILDGLLLHDREPDRVVASAENGIGVYITVGTKYAIIECFNDGEIVAGLSDRRGNIQNLEVPADPREIMRSLEEILANLDA